MPLEQFDGTLYPSAAIRGAVALWGGAGMQWWYDALVGGAAYELVRLYVMGPLIVAALGSAVLKMAFNKLQEKKQLFVFFGGCFASLVILFAFLAPRPNEPNLIGAIEGVFTGTLPTTDNDVVAVFEVGIANTGGMQSVVKQWGVVAEVNGVRYTGAFIPMPSNFTFNHIPAINEDQPEAVTFKRDDNLLEKGLFPIQPGAFLRGILFVAFRNVNPTVFKGIVDYTVSYQDVLSKQYSMPIKATGQIGTVPMMPGLHTEMACRVPPKPMQPLETIIPHTADPPFTGSIPKQN